MSTHRKRVWVIQNLAPLHGLFFKDLALARPLGGALCRSSALSTLGGRPVCSQARRVPLGRQTAPRGWLHLGVQLSLSQ